MEFTQIILYITLFLALYFQIFMLLSLFENRKRNKTKENKDFFPSVTIIIPAWNEEKTVSETIQSLLDLDYPKEKLNIVVVNDGSTDNTSNEVKKFSNENQVLLLEKENGGKHSALNLALKNIHTELVGALDADSFVGKNALKFIVHPFKNEQVASIASTIKVSETKNFWGIIQKADYFMIAFLRKSFAHMGSVFITPGPFSFYRTSVVKKLGGWKKAHNTEDIEIGIRLQANHYLVENVENAEVFTKPMTTFKSLFKQRMRWSYGFFKNAWDYKYLFFNKEYGNMGMFGLPSFLLANVISVFIYFLTIMITLGQLWEWIERISVTGFYWKNFDFNWFFFDTGVLLILSIFLTILVVWSIIMGKVLTNEKRYFSFDILLYLVVYMVIAPLWVIAAMWKVLTGVENKWEDN